MKDRLLDYYFNENDPEAKLCTNISPFVTGLSTILGIYAFGFNGMQSIVIPFSLLLIL